MHRVARLGGEVGVVRRGRVAHGIRIQFARDLHSLFGIVIQRGVEGWIVGFRNQGTAIPNPLVGGAGSGLGLRRRTPCRTGQQEAGTLQQFSPTETHDLLPQDCLSISSTPSTRLSGVLLCLSRPRRSRISTAACPISYFGW